VQQTKDKIKEHKEKKRGLVQQGIQLGNQYKLSPSEAKLNMQRYLIEEYNRVRNRRQKRENLLTSWSTGTLKAEEVVSRGYTIEREDERLAAREPQVLLKYTKPGSGLNSSSASSSAAMYRPSTIIGTIIGGVTGPELEDPNVPKTPKSMNSKYNEKLSTLVPSEKDKFEKIAKLAGGYKSTLFSSRCIQEAFGAL